MEYVLTTEGLSKQYKHFKALDNLTMHVPKGAIYGFVGRNGAGKTTLIRLICGLQQQTKGTYTLYGKDSGTGEIAESRRRMGAVVETPSIYAELSENTGKKKAKNFSLGMKQRLGIAVALAGDPDFLVLDEPINGLDPQGIIEMRELILKLNREHQITVLISSHILDELSRLATHYGFIDGGRMVREISAEELEQASRKCVRAEVTDTKALARVLDKMNIEYNIVSKQQADIFTKVNVTDLALALAEEDCRIITMNERDESLESYFVSLVGGASHE